MKEQLIHILDQSVCLSRKQMKEYLSGAMLPEEVHAAEVHLNTCALCSLAMEGFEEHSEQALAAISALNSGFLKDHFDNISPQIHLNSIAHAAMPSAEARKRIALTPLWRIGSVAAAALLIFGILWAFERNSNHEAAPTLALATNSGSAGSGSQGSGAVRPVANAKSPVQPAALRQLTVADAAPSLPATSGLNEQEKRKGALNSEVLQTASPAKTTDKQAVASAVSSGATDIPASTGVAVKDVPATKIYSEYNPASAAPGEEAPEKKEPVVSETDVAAARATPGNTTQKTKSATAKQEADPRNDIERGDESYGKGSYGAALAHYKKGMSSADEHTRYHSMVMAAECYAALGNKARAEELLQRVIDNGPGADRRSAKRALRRMK